MGVADIRVGDLFKSNAQTLVNTVNCVGVMGKGIAAAFKRRYPEMYEDYQRRCERGQVKLGQPYLWRGEHQWILNFPTKDHWRSVSRLAEIEAGLHYLVDHYQEWGIQSLAVPPLGCGNGGLDWTVVGPTLHRYLDKIDVPVVLYAPHGTPSSQLALPVDGDIEKRTAPTLPTAALALVDILHRISQKRFHPLTGRTKFQKLAYFATAAGIPTGLDFERASYGPSASDLKRVTTGLVNNGALDEERRGRMFITQVGRTFDDAAEKRSDELGQWEEAMERVADLMLRMDTRDAEVAATVHYAWSELAGAENSAPSEGDVLEAVMEWKQRRRPPLEASEVALAIRNLNALGWIDAEPDAGLPYPDDPELADTDLQLREVAPAR